MDGQDPIQQVTEIAGRVKAGTASPRDVQLLTLIRQNIDPSATTVITLIDDALANQAAPTDWTAQPEATAAINERIAAGGGGGGFGDLPLPPETPPQGMDRGWGSPFDAIGALGTGAAATINAIPDPVGAVISDPAQGSAFAQDNPWDIIGGNLAEFGDKFRGLQGTNIPSANQPMGSDFRKPSVSAEGTLPPTQAPPAPDPVAAYETAPLSGYRFDPQSAPVNETHMPGDLPPSGLGAGAAQTDWKTERRAMREGGLTKEEKRTKRALGGVESVSLPEDSAFAGVSDVHSLLYQPDMMARMIAQKMGGGAMTAAMILPEVENAVRLVQSGQLGGGRRREGLGPQTSDTEQLEAIESFVTQMSGSRGTQIDPYSSYEEGLKRALHTSEDQLQRRATDSDPNAGPMARLTSQIDTTNEALLSGAGGMGPGAYKKLESRLNQAANEWLDVAMRSAPGSYVTYPQFLRDQKAKSWFRRQE